MLSIIAGHTKSYLEFSSELVIEPGRGQFSIEMPSYIIWLKMHPIASNAKPSFIRFTSFFQGGQLAPRQVGQLAISVAIPFFL